MVYPEEIYTFNPRRKSVANYEKVLSIVASDDDTRNIIVDLCHELYKYSNSEVTYVEVGTYFGGTFNEILNRCKDIKLNAIGIDLYEDFEVKDDGNTHYGDVAAMADVDEKLRANGHTNFKLMKGDTIEMINKLDKMENVVSFIDSNHTYEAVKNDFFNMRKKIKNGYIVFDDLNWVGIDKFFNEIAFLYKTVYRTGRVGAVEIA